MEFKNSAPSSFFAKWMSPAELNTRGTEFHDAIWAMYADWICSNSDDFYFDVR